MHILYKIVGTCYLIYRFHNPLKWPKPKTEHEYIILFDKDNTVLEQEMNHTMSFCTYILAMNAVITRGMSPN